MGCYPIAQVSSTSRSSWSLPSLTSRIFVCVQPLQEDPPRSPKGRLYRSLAPVERHVLGSPSRSERLPPPNREEQEDLQDRKRFGRQVGCYRLRRYRQDHQPSGRMAPLVRRGSSLSISEMSFVLTRQLLFDSVAVSSTRTSSWSREVFPVPSRGPSFSVCPSRFTPRGLTWRRLL